MKTKTAELNELYDNLSLDAQAIWDSISTFGYKPEKGPAGLWTAQPLKGGVVLGPADSLEALHSQVKEQAGADEVIDAEVVGEETTDGYLPGMSKRQTVVPELRDPILDYQGYKEERIAALAKEVEAKKTVDALMHQYEKCLAVDKVTGIKSYRVADIVVELVPGEDKLKSRRATDDEDDD
jgi:hypothetical protein